MGSREGTKDTGGSKEWGGEGGGKMTQARRPTPGRWCSHSSATWQVTHFLQSPQATTRLFGFHPAVSFVLFVSRAPPTEDTCKPILLVSCIPASDDSSSSRKRWQCLGQDPTTPSFLPSLFRLSRTHQCVAKSGAKAGGKQTRDESRVCSPLSLEPCACVATLTHLAKLPQS